MAVLWKIVAGLFLLSAIEGKPLDLQTTDESVLLARNQKVNGQKTLQENPNLYLILDDAADQLDDTEIDSPVQKRSAEEVDDLETAAGTNVLRPLFVYRQQLAYRERVKKGAFRRPGIRPRF